MNKTKELKRILMGRLVHDEKGVLMARPKGVYTSMSGFLDGYFTVLFCGVMDRERCYHSDYDLTKTKNNAYGYLQQIGQELRLMDNPQALACFTGRRALTPCVIVMEFSGSGSDGDSEPVKTKEKKHGGKRSSRKEAGVDITVHICTGRSPFGLLRCMHMFHRLERHFGDLFERVKE
ncbi:MAG: hypothetical protein SPG09_09910 [Lachnospiraceae bacterium]|nr:hypothetical protein [bacterium]MDY5517908.1 hypothetical protein [Lachnospiraceae bacterium]